MHAQYKHAHGAQSDECQLCMWQVINTHVALINIREDLNALDMDA
jgi:hypothetical protein